MHCCIFKVIIVSAMLVPTDGLHSTAASKPDLEVFAIAGESVLLNCSLPFRNNVTSLTHDAMWLRGRNILLPEPDGKVLGSGGRLSVVQHSTNSVPSASLRIDNVQLGDEGRFECLWANGQRSFPIFLIVIEPPSQPIITSLTSSPLIASAGRRAEFGCSTNKGHPQPNYNWYLGMSDSENSDTWQVVSVEWISTLANKTTTSSVLTLDGSALFSKMTLMCVVSHPGYANGNATVLLKPRVLVPPSSLTIWPRPSSPFNASTTFRTTCSVVAPEQSPPVALSWLRNGKPLNNNPTASSREINTDNVRLSLRRVGNLVVSEMELVVKPEDNFAVFRCEARSELLDQPLYDQFQLIVHFAPVPVNGTSTLITSEAVWAVANMLPFKIKCLALANPGSRITWFRNLTRVSGLPMTHSETPTSNGLGIITRSDLDVIFSPDQFKTNTSEVSETAGIASVNVSCLASNHIGSYLSTMDVQVVLPPTGLLLVIGKGNIAVDSSDNLRIMAGQVLQLSCTVDRSDWLPLSSEKEYIFSDISDPVIKSIGYKWLQGHDKTLLADSSSLSLFVSPAWNGRELLCVASSNLLFPLTGSVHSLERRLRLDVLFGPGQPTTSLAEHVQLPAREGTEIVATCLPSTGNPQPTARWIVTALQQPSILGPTFRTERAIGGGSTIRLLANAYLDGIAIACEAFNQFGRNTSELVLSTLYRPIFLDCPSDVSVMVFVNKQNIVVLPESSRLTCLVKAVPVIVVDDVFLTIDNEDVTHTILVDDRAASAFINEGRLDLPRTLLETKLPLFNKNISKSDILTLLPSSLLAPISPHQVSVEQMNGKGDDITRVFDSDPLAATDIGTIAVTVTVSNDIGKASRTIFVRFAGDSALRQANLFDNGNVDQTAANVEENLFHSNNVSPASSAALSILVACLTAVGVMLIVANVLFVSLYIARRAILKRPNFEPGKHNRSSKSSPSNGTTFTTSSSRVDRPFINSGSRRLMLTDGNMFNVLLDDVEQHPAQQNNQTDDNGHLVFSPSLHTSLASDNVAYNNKRLVTLEDVAGLVLQRNTHQSATSCSGTLKSTFFEMGKQLQRKSHEGEALLSSPSFASSSIHQQNFAESIVNGDLLPANNCEIVQNVSSSRIDKTTNGKNSNCSEITDGDNDSGRGDSNRGVLLLEAICSCSPTSNYPNSSTNIPACVVSDTASMSPSNDSLSRNRASLLFPSEQHIKGTPIQCNPVSFPPNGTVNCVVNKNICMTVQRSAPLTTFSCDEPSARSTPAITPNSGNGCHATANVNGAASNINNGNNINHKSSSFATKVSLQFIDI